MIPKLIYTPKEAAEALNTSQQKIRNLCESGEIISYRQGVNWKIPVDGLKEYVMCRGRMESSTRLDR